jgi:hypothetical protein
VSETSLGVAVLYQGDCESNKVNIAQAFRKSMKRLLVNQKSCPSNILCEVTDIVVHCGRTRAKRSVSAVSDAEFGNLTIEYTVRGTLDMPEEVITDTHQKNLSIVLFDDVYFKIENSIRDSEFVIEAEGVNTTVTELYPITDPAFIDINCTDGEILQHGEVTNYCGEIKLY